HHRTAGRAARAVGIRAVDEPIGVVVDSVVADLDARLDAGAITEAAGVLAVDQVVAVVVLAVVADLRLGRTGRRPLRPTVPRARAAVGVGAVVAAETAGAVAARREKIRPPAAARKSQQQHRQSSCQPHFFPVYDGRNTGPPQNSTTCDTA